MENNSGIYPSANRVLILQESVRDERERSQSKIVIPEWVEQKADQSQVLGRLVACGPDAFKHSQTITRDSDGCVVEVSQSGYSEPFAAPGDRILFAKYSGLRIEGVDGGKYILTNDEDITARVSDDFALGVIDPRKRAARIKADD